MSKTFQQILMGGLPALLKKIEEENRAWQEQGVGYLLVRHRIQQSADSPQDLPHPDAPVPKEQG